MPCRDPADDVVELAVGAGEETHAELGQRAARHLGEPHAEQHLIRRRPLGELQQRDDVFLLVDVAAGQADRAVDDVLVTHRAREHDAAPVGAGFDLLVREQLLDLRRQARQIALDVDLVALDPARAVPDEHRDRARRLAVDQQLVRRGDERVGDVGAGQRHARDLHAGIDDGGSPDRQAHALAIGSRALDRHPNND